MNNVVWLDIETTGLDERFHSMISVGAVNFDNDWQSRREFYKVIYQPNPSKLLWSPEALDMHRKSGLYEQMRCVGSKTPVAPVEFFEDVYKQLCDWAESLLQLSGQKLILAGNSVHFDRRFLKLHMPKLEDFLHYRMIDVSGMHEALKIFGGIEIPKPAYSHRAIEDANSSIELCKKIMEHVR